MGKFAQWGGLSYRSKELTLHLMYDANLKLSDALLALLVKVDACADENFTGIGLIVSTKVDELPIISLRPSSDPGDVVDVATKLAQISNPTHEHHDGFHVLDPKLRIHRLAQYFSPPIAPSAMINRSRRFGGRYLAALFGSALPEVLIAGIASSDFGIALFHNGREISYHRSRLRDNMTLKVERS